MKALILAAALLCAAAVANADPVLTPYLGANVVAFEHSSGLPSDWEMGGGGAISLSPHVSAVGSAWYGLGESYLRGTLGGRVTITDVADPNFSVGLGLSYNASSKPSVRPQETTGDVTVGWKPYPTDWPRLTVGAGASYGFTSQHPYLLFGVRWALDSF